MLVDFATVNYIGFVSRHQQPLPYSCDKHEASKTWPVVILGIVQLLLNISSPSDTLSPPANPLLLLSHGISSPNSLWHDRHTFQCRGSPKATPPLFDFFRKQAKEVETWSWTALLLEFPPSPQPVVSGRGLKWGHRPTTSGSTGAQPTVLSFYAGWKTISLHRKTRQLKVFNFPFSSQGKLYY